MATRFLAVDEDREDILQRLLQRRGVSRVDCEQQQGRTHAAALRAVQDMPLRIYDGSHTIESAAEDLARFADADGMRCALFVDSIQTATCDADDPDGTAYANVTARTRAIRDAATRHRMLVVATSEMGRAGYRSREDASRINDLATAKESGAIEYSARVLMSLRSVAGEPDLAELRLTKNKHGPIHRDGDRGIYLRLRTATQGMDVDEDYAPPDAGAVDSKALAKAEAEAAAVADYLAEHPGTGLRELHRGVHAATGLGKTRVDHGIGFLVECDAIVICPGPNKTERHYLVGAELSDAVLDRLPPGRRCAVRAAVPPPPDPEPDPGPDSVIECADECAGTPGENGTPRVNECAARPPYIGGVHTAHSSARTAQKGDQHTRDRDTPPLPEGAEPATIDDGMAERPKRRASRRRRKQ